MFSQSFQNSFVSALPQGSKMYSDSLANERANEQLKMQQAAEARNAAEYERKLGIENKVTALQEQLLNPNKGNYGLNGPSKFASEPTPLDINTPVPAVGGGIKLTEGMNLGGVGVKAGAPTGMQPTQQLGIAPPAKEQVLSNRQAPARGDEQRILAQIAMLKGDHEGYGRARAVASDMDFEDGFNQHMKGFTGAEEQVAPLVEYINEKTRATLGDEEKGGFRRLSVVKEGGKPMFAKLTRQDQAKLYAAHMMMDTNPSKAMQIMQGVNKDLAAALQADTNLYKVVGDNNNDVAAKQHTVDYHNQSLGLRRQEMAASAEYRKKLFEQKGREGGDPKIIAQINDVAAQFENAKTPEERRVLEQKHNVLMSQLLVSMGKPRMLSYAPGGGGSGAGDGKFHKAEEAGTIGTVNGQRVKVLADGSYGHVDAELDPMAWVSKNHPKLAQEFQGKVSVTPDGRGLFIGTQEDFERSGGRVIAFDYKNPGDMNELYKSLRTGAAGDRLADEIALGIQKSSDSGAPSYPSRATRGQLRYSQNGDAYSANTRPSGTPPSIYDGAAAWEQYRKEQAAGLRPPANTQAAPAKGKGLDLHSMFAPRDPRYDVSIGAVR